MVREICSRDPSLLNDTDSGGQNILHLAAFWGCVEMVELLVELGADCNAKNLVGQRPLDIALNWGNVDCTDAIRSAGGLSLFEEKCANLESEIHALKIKLIAADLENEAERRRTQEALDLLERTAGERDFVQDKWTAESLCGGSIQAAQLLVVQHDLTAAGKLRDEFWEKYNAALAWGQAESVMRRKLKKELEETKETLRSTREQLQIAVEEKRVAMVDRNLALQIRDHALRESRAAEEARVTAEETCMRALRLADEMRPYKKRCAAVERELGLKEYRESLQKVLDVCPRKVLDGAVQALTSLAARASTAQPSSTQPLITGQSISMFEKDALTALTENTLPEDEVFMRKEKQKQKQKQTKGKKQKQKQKQKKGKKIKGSRRRSTLLQRVNDEAAALPDDQIQRDSRRHHGERHLMGKLPSVPFDLLVLDPYGRGMEALTCSHVKTDSQGMEILKVRLKDSIDVKSDHWHAADQKRYINFQMKQAAARARQVRRTEAAKRAARIDMIHAPIRKPAWNSNALLSQQKNNARVSSRKDDDDATINNLWASAFGGAAPPQERLLQIPKGDFDRRPGTVAALPSLSNAKSRREYEKRERRRKKQQALK
eukprot:g5018.t1